MPKSTTTKAIVLDLKAAIADRDEEIARLNNSLSLIAEIILDLDTSPDAFADKHKNLTLRMGIDAVVQVLAKVSAGDR